MKFPFKSSKPPLIKDITIFTYIFLWLSHVFPWFFLETSINLRDVPMIFQVAIAGCHDADAGGATWTKSYWKSQFLIGKSTISMVIFNSYVKLPEGIVSFPMKKIKKCWFSIVM